MPEPRDNLTNARPEPAAEPGLPTTAGSTDPVAPVPASVTDEAPPFHPPLHKGDIGRLGRYRIIKRLGKGGMGEVYLGYDDTLRRKVAIKVLPPRLAEHPGARQRFLREARTAAAVRSEHIVTIIDVDEDDGIPFIAMEYLQGCSLDRYLTSHPPLTAPQIVRVGLEVARGLAAAHEHGLVHRDIKPANLWLEAPNGRVKILDFGLAKETDPGEEGSLTQTGQVVGTPAYMSPEQARGEPVGPATDLFSLGIVLYRLATGRLPFQGSTAMAVLMALGLDEPPPVRDLNPAIPEPLAAIIHQLLAKKPADRPPSALAVQEALAAMSKKRPRPATLAAPPPNAEPGKLLAAPSPTPMATPLVTPLSAVQITVEVQPENVWDSIEQAVPTAAESAEGSNRSRQARGAMPWLTVVALIIVAALSVVVLINVLNQTKRRQEPDANKHDEPPTPVRVFFNGKDLQGWRAAEGYWKVDDGQLIGAFPSGGKPTTTFAYAQHRYRDFELSFQVRLPGGGRSALFFRAEPVRSSFLLSGPACELGPTDTGSLYLKPGEWTAGLPPDQVAALFKPDEFNQVTVSCVGKHVTITVNGKVTVNGDYDLPTQGVIGWQLSEQQGTREVQIKDIQFTDLSAAAPR